MLSEGVVLAKEGLAAGCGGIEYDFGQDGIAMGGDVLLYVGIDGSDCSEGVALQRVSVPLARDVPEIVHY